MNGYTSKRDIEALFDSVQKEIKAYNQRRNEIVSDPDLTPQGKEKKCAETRAAMERNCKMHLATAARLLKEARQRMEREKGAEVKQSDDLTHQLRLSNAIKTLELRGRAMSDEELVQLAAPLSRDPHAEQTLVAAARLGGRDPMRTHSVIEHLFADGAGRKRAIEELQKLEDFVRGLWNRYGADAGDLSVCMAMSMKLEHWNENFTKYE